MHTFGKLPVFFVIFLLVLLPVSVSAQIAGFTPDAYAPVEQGIGTASVVPESDFSVQATCTWPDRECAGKCWLPCSSGTWYCGASKAVCCSSPNKFCKDTCWTPCSSSNIWVCTDSGAVCKPKSECTNSKYPISCGGSCWGNCGSGYRFECVSGKGQCKLESCTDSSYPYWCGNNCWSGCGSGNVFICENGAGKCCPSDKPYYWDGGCQKCPQDKPKSCGGKCYSGNECTNSNYPHWNCKPDGGYTCCPSDFPTYCARTDNCWKNQDECDKAQQCGSEGWTVCRDPNLPAWNCKPDGHSICCPSDKPFWVDGACRKCPADKPKQCGAECYSDVNCESGKVAICDKNNVVKCCPSDWPYYCPKSDTCAKDSNNCNALNKCGSEGWTFCTDSNYPHWNCRSDGVSRCCAAGYPYLWNSDYLCHTIPEVGKCAVPDGSSAQCDCNSNSDCPPERPYCEENYPSPISDGYDACVAVVPDYCGDGKCSGGETYSSCQADCGSLAPKGTINVDVYYSSGANANKPISGAYVYLDGMQKGSTGSDGRLILQATYGSHELKVECPNKVLCESRSISVNGNQFASFVCNCPTSLTTSNLRVRLMAQTPEYPRSYPAANVVVLVDGENRGSTNQFGTIDLEQLPGGERRLDVQLLAFEDGKEKKYTGGATISLDESYEEKSFILIKDANPAAAISVLENGKEVFTLEEASPEVLWFAVIYVVIVVGGIIWDAYDYNQCLERNAEVWQPAQSNWNNYNCVTSTSMTPDQYNDCMEKSLSRNQNSASGCEFEGSMLLLNFVPIGGPVKTLGKLGVNIGKGVIKLIPYLDNAAEGVYRTYKFIRNSETFVTVTDKLNKGAKYVYKLVDNAFKIFDNVVGLIVNKIAKNPDAWAKISERVDNLLLNAGPGDIPVEKLRSVRTIQGALGEKTKDEYLAVIKEALEKDGATVIIARGTPGSVYRQTGKYVAEFTDTGTGLKIFPKDAQGNVLRGQQIGEIDGLIIVNDKPVVIEAKASRAENIANDISSDLQKKQEFFEKKLGTVQDLTGQMPEVLLLIPKGEASVKLGPWWNPFAPKLSEEIDSLSVYLGNKGSYLAYDEFPVGADSFERAARNINNAANQ